ncbi:MaoC/PaaZ C-terminal domain-containing protein [Actinocorallia aurea]
MSFPSPQDPAGAWAGVRLGERTASWTERDAILYALSVGARAEELDLVYERRLRVLPTFGLTLAQWAPDVAGTNGAFAPTTALHASQRLEVAAPLPRGGELTLSARVSAVWDKGSAAIFDIEVESRCFTATWSIFAPGRGGFGGDRGPSARSASPAGTPPLTVEVPTFAEQAALYRLSGDLHALHVDPEAAKTAGLDRPILHGLATLATCTVGLARALGAHPADLGSASGRFSSPVLPGDTLALHAHPANVTTDYTAHVADRTVLSGATASYGG